MKKVLKPQRKNEQLNSLLLIILVATIYFNETWCDWLI